MVIEARWDTDLQHAKEYFDTHPDKGEVYVVGLDEVGRGAIAGPVMVGAFAVRVERQADARLETSKLPPGIRDSKLLSAQRRHVLFQELSAAACPSSVGQASAQEIDAKGISAALTLAASRALAGVLEQCEEPVAAIILDGNVDYVSRGFKAGLPCQIDVRIKADQDCMSVACASILAKVTRDTFMQELSGDCPHYEWAKNKGYASAAHRAALAMHGLHSEHRSSWNLLPETAQPAFDLSK